MIKISLSYPFFTDHQMSRWKKIADDLQLTGREVITPTKKVSLHQDVDEFNPEKILYQELAALKRSKELIVCIDDYDKGSMVCLGWFYAKCSRSIYTFSERGFDVNPIIGVMVETHFWTYEDMIAYFQQEKE